MNYRQIIQWVWRELRRERRYAFSFMINVALGLSGFLTLVAFESASEQGLQNRSHELLGADLRLTAPRRLDPAELEILRGQLPSQAVQSNLVEMYSMVASPTRTRLIHIKAIEDNYPLYGVIRLIGEKSIANSQGLTNEVGKYPPAWADQELATQLNVKIGDQLKIGEETFLLAALVANDSTGSRSMLWTPQIYISQKFLGKTQLIQPGSTVKYRSLLRWSGSPTPKALAQKLNTVLTDPAIRIRTHDQASENINRSLLYLLDYLGLAALVTLFLAAIGVSYHFRSFISSRLRSIATLHALGIPHRWIRRTYLIQVLTLGALGALLAIGMAWSLLPLFNHWLNDFTTLPLKLHISLKTFCLGIWLGAGGSLLITLPILMRLRHNPTAALFQEAAHPNLIWRWQEMIWFLPAILAYSGLAFWQANSWKVGGVFIGAMAGAIVLITGIGGGAGRMLERLPLIKHHLLRLAVRELTHHKLRSLSAFMALALAMVLLTLVPQIHTNLASELENPGGRNKPSLFLYDIQEEQLSALQQKLAQRGAQLSNLSPLSQARLLSVNGIAFEKIKKTMQLKTREEEVEERFRNRNFNLSSRAEFDRSETIIAGKPFSGVYQPGQQKFVEISVERRFAQRLDWHLGDELLFQVEGRPIAGKITSLRRVRWSSFTPNFFIQLQPGVLDNAPKIYLAAITAHGTIEKNALQDHLVRHFPNIAIVDVERLSLEIDHLLNEMSLTLFGVSGLTCLVGLIVLLSLIRQQSLELRGQVALMRLLGADHAALRGLISWQFLMLTGFAALVGSAIGCGLSFGLTRQIFELNWLLEWRSLVIFALLLPLFCLAMALLSTRRTLKTRPIYLLERAL